MTDVARPSTATDQPAFSEESRRALRRMVAERQAKHRLPGAFGAVVRDGALAWSHGVGTTDVTSPTSTPTDDTRFQIASISKTFTAVAILALRDEGRLDLDDPVGKHIPENTHAGVTIRRLLSHSSGMQREPVGDVWETLVYPDRAAMVEGWNAAEQILPTHHTWHYSNLGFAVLGEIVTRLDGRPWIDSIRARILDPLELRRTGLAIEAADTTPGYYVPPFTDVPVPEPLLDIAAMAPVGGLASTARDLAVWAGFWASPVDEVLKSDTVEEMCRPQIVADPVGWRSSWGLGVGLIRHQDRVFVGHTGGMPGHITGVFVDRESGTGGIALMNSSASPDPSAFAIDLATYALDHEPADPEPWIPGTEVPAELTGVLGRWFSEGAGFSFSVRQGRLEARAEGAPDTQPPSVFRKLADDLYRTESGREAGELLRITRDADGRAVKLNWATYLFGRLPQAFGEWL